MAYARKNKKIAVALIGAGYIADFHARGIRNNPGARLTLVCDTNEAAAKRFAKKWNIDHCTDLQDVVSRKNIDVAHVLVPPNAHFSVSKRLIEAGISVFIEKPMCPTPEECTEIIELAKRNDVLVGVNHNMLFSRAYTHLRDLVYNSDLGLINGVSFKHFQEMSSILNGPYNLWMLQSFRNMVLEIGPHIFSALIDLAGPLREAKILTDRTLELPTGSIIPISWQIISKANYATVETTINLGPGFNERKIHVHGISGTSTADLDADTCTTDFPTPVSTDLDRYKRSQSIKKQLNKQSKIIIKDYVTSRLKLSSIGNPYGRTFIKSISSFYNSISSGVDVDRRLSGELAYEVIDLCIRVAHADIKTPRIIYTPYISRAVEKRTERVLVIGASGFIGRELVRQLNNQGYQVEALLRGSAELLQTESGPVKVVRGDITNPKDLDRAIAGVDTVFHLARPAEAKSWNDYKTLDITPTQAIAEACLRNHVRRLVYTGTIDSFYAGARAGMITSSTPLDANINRRNYYARAKAESEVILRSLHETSGLPVVIARPGIVIGKGGNLFHWGVGLWTPPSICQTWGDGDNPLPFVLVADVASGLIRCMQVSGLEGKTYNLVDIPLLSARDYINEVEAGLGIKERVTALPSWRSYTIDMAKWFVKLAVRHPDSQRVPAYSDWESRTQKAVFDCSDTRRELGWTPASSREALVGQVIRDSARTWTIAVKEHGYGEVNLSQPERLKEHERVT